MLSARRLTLVYWICLFGLLLLFALAPRGCTSTKIEATSGLNGNPSIQITPEQTLAEKSKLSISEKYAPPEIYAEGFTKNDWLFVVLYSCTLRADLSLAPSMKGTNITLAINMPGQITGANANRIENGKAIWYLKLGRNYQMDVSSRHTRWWIIILTVVLFILLGYSWFVLRAQGKKLEEKTYDSGRQYF